MGSNGLAWLQALRQPDQALTWSLSDWERVIRLARQLRLLSRLAEALDAAGLVGSLPIHAQQHLLAEQRLSRWRVTEICWAIERVADALGDAGYPKVLLKGAGYISQALPIARGRLPSDLDIMVPRECIGDAQARLSAAGWCELPLDAHDRRYYHAWSHEVPPLVNPALAVELDLHHNILPPLGHIRLDGATLINRSRPARWAGWRILDPVDQVLHSAAHLFFDSEFRGRLRDLVDIDGLLRHFDRQEHGFWPRLTARSDELGLGEPLALACRFATAWLGTPIPDPVRHRIAEAGPGSLARLWLVPTLSHVLRPTEPDETPSRRLGAAATILLARHHFRRMPLRLLVPHLWHKLRKPAAPEPLVLKPRRR